MIGQNAQVPPNTEIDASNGQVTGQNSKAPTVQCNHGKGVNGKNNGKNEKRNKKPAVPIKGRLDQLLDRTNVWP